ncbi:hypothetical protein AAF712_003588 [Marasmius tenuissimus]|uniref:Oxidoreductase AflY n=1 Tax=Marasmius tenuissimus TaxID=585030 RepID=A0ABR3A5J4_9AGAR
MSSTYNTFDLWPVPSSPPTPLAPNRLPGTSPQSTEKLRELLKINHENWHTFYDEAGRHNHISHHLLALWSMGADAEILQKGYDLHSQLQKPKGDPKEVITRENFVDHLADRSYYKGYVDFFTGVMREKGSIATLEEFIFSDEMNLQNVDEDRKVPEMLDHFHSGILHPLIHVGNGVEFGLPGMIVEGLAQTAVSKAGNEHIVPRAMFEYHSDREGVHVLNILARVYEDRSLSVNETLPTEVKDDMAASLLQYALDWLPDLRPSLELAQEKVKELEWACTIMYAIPGFKAGKDFNADFIAMHLVTSSLFLSSLVASLSPRSRALLLRTQLAQCLLVWTRLGKPRLDIAGFYAADTAHPNTLNQPLSPPAPSKFALPSSTSPLAVNPNPWFFILRQALVHPDDHVSKTIRTLNHYASKYGSVPAGYFGERARELEDADKLDGTLFVRAAGLTMNRLAREVEELPPHYTFWDRKAFSEGEEKDIFAIFDLN